MDILTRQFKVKSEKSKEDFVKKLNINVSKMFIDNNANPDDYVWSHKSGLMNDDFIRDHYTCIITAIRYK